MTLARPPFRREDEVEMVFHPARREPEPPVFRWYENVTQEASLAAVQTSYRDVGPCWQPVRDADARKPVLGIKPPKR